MNAMNPKEEKEFDNLSEIIGSFEMASQTFKNMGEFVEAIKKSPLNTTGLENLSLATLLNRRSGKWGMILKDDIDELIVKK